MEVYYDRKAHAYFSDILACKEVAFATNQVAIGYTTFGGEILFNKHGIPENVNAWAEKTRKKYLESGLSDWAEEIKVVVFPEGYDLEKINRILSTTGYLGILLREEGIE